MFGPLRMIQVPLTSREYKSGLRRLLYAKINLNSNGRPWMTPSLCFGRVSGRDVIPWIVITTANFHV